MAQLNETTPATKRTFTLELTETEAEIIGSMAGQASCAGASTGIYEVFAEQGVNTMAYKWVKSSDTVRHITPRLEKV